MFELTRRNRPSRVAFGVEGGATSGFGDLALQMDEAVNENLKDGTLQASLHPLASACAGPWSSLPPGGAARHAGAELRGSSIERGREAKAARDTGCLAQRYSPALRADGAFAHELFSILSFVVMTPMQVLFLILSTIAFGWIALGSLSAALGFLPLFAGEKADTIEPPVPSLPLEPRTALLFPVYHEEPARIAGAIEAMARELQTLGKNKNFDVFVLSDTRGEAQEGT